MDAPSHELKAGFVFARDFRIAHKIGEGGMGIVYAAEQLSTSKMRALKLMHSTMLHDPRLRDRFLQEAHAVAQIESDHVAEVVAAGVDDATGTPWLAMELLRGETLDSLVRGRGPLGPRDLLELGTQMRHALAQAHTRGIVHRDLKPENLFIGLPRRAGIPFTLKVLDFGIAKWMQETRNVANSQVLGSPLWMAPEQWQPSAPIGPATDVWALALVMFFALTGRTYWRTAAAGDIGRIIVEVMTETQAPPSARAVELGATAEVPAGFDEWFLACLAREPLRRVSDADVALAAFEELFDGAKRSFRPVYFRDGRPHGAIPPTEPAPHVMPTALQIPPDPGSVTRAVGQPGFAAAASVAPGSASTRALWRFVSAPLAPHATVSRVLVALAPAIADALSVEAVLVGLTEDARLDRIGVRTATSERAAYDRAASVMAHTAGRLGLSRPSIYAREELREPLRVEPTAPIAWVLGPRLARIPATAAAFLCSAAVAVDRPELRLRAVAPDIAQLRRILLSATEIARKTGGRAPRDMVTSVLRGHVVTGSDVAARLAESGDACTEEALAAWMLAADTTLARVGLLASGKLAAAAEGLGAHPAMFATSTIDPILVDLEVWARSAEHGQARLLWGPPSE